MDITSPAFSEESSLPPQYTCEGAGISPPLNWLRVPVEAQSLLLTLEDPDAPGGTFTHWILFNIPPDTPGLPENFQPPKNAGMDWRQGMNDYGHPTYGPPCPPKGSQHHYRFWLAALNKKLDLPEGVSHDDLIKAVEFCTIKGATLDVTFGR